MAGFGTYVKVDGTIFADELGHEGKRDLILCFLNIHLNNSAAGGAAVFWERGQWLEGPWGRRKLFTWLVGGRSINLYFCQEALLFRTNMVEVS